ncbi:MAG: DUF6776 family protein [Steroidobacteraceae bacterium]
MQAPGRLVIRTYAPLRRWLIIGGVSVLGGVLLYLAFETGRVSARSADAALVARFPELEAHAAELETLNRELRLKLAAQETGAVGQVRERAEVSRTIGELQAQVARQAQDLAFYRGLAGDSAAAPPVRIQQFRVAPLGAPGRFAIKLVLGRPVRPEDVVAGTLVVTVEGMQGDKPATLDLAQLTGGKSRELRFSYRYLQMIETEIALPAGFAPARSTLEVRVARKDVTPIRQTFLWTTEAD